MMSSDKISMVAWEIRYDLIHSDEFLRLTAKIKAANASSDLDSKSVGLAVSEELHVFAKSFVAAKIDARRIRECDLENLRVAVAKKLKEVGIE